MAFPILEPSRPCARNEYDTKFFQCASLLYLPGWAGASKKKQAVCLQCRCLYSRPARRTWVYYDKVRQVLIDLSPKQTTPPQIWSISNNTKCSPIATVVVVAVDNQAGEMRPLDGEPKYLLCVILVRCSVFDSRWQVAGMAGQPRRIIDVIRLIAHQPWIREAKAKVQSKNYTILVLFGTWCSNRQGRRCVWRTDDPPRVCFAVVLERGNSSSGERPDCWRERREGGATTSLRRQEV